MTGPCTKITFISPLFLVVMGYLLAYVFSVLPVFDMMFLMLFILGIVVALAFENKLGFYVLAVFILVCADLIFYPYPTIQTIDFFAILNALKTFFTNIIVTIPPVFIGGCIGRLVRDLHYHFIGCPLRGIDHNMERL